eukprot:6411005-Heterocapsa_arctica.AAC.1
MNAGPKGGIRRNIGRDRTSETGNGDGRKGMKEKGRRAHQQREQPMEEGKAKEEKEGSGAQEASRSTHNTL